VTLRALPPTGRTHVVGVLNLTPDSFSDGGRFAGAAREEAAPRTGAPMHADTASPADALRAPGAAFHPDVAAVLAAARQMVADGAAVLDVGAVSTRPGAAPVSPDEEWARLAPILAPLRAAVSVPLSLDTTSADVLERALAVGVDLVNDVSALAEDPRMSGLVASSGLPVVLMHRRGTPATMQRAPSYADAPAEVWAELLAAIARSDAAGIPRDRLLLDPGIGFGKRAEDNLALLAALPEFVVVARAAGARTLLGCSRKAFLGALIARDGDAQGAARSVAGREHATTATTVLAALAGVDFIRVHAVRAASDALAVTAAVRAASVAGMPSASADPGR